MKGSRSASILMLMMFTAAALIACGKKDEPKAAAAVPVPAAAAAPVKAEPLKVAFVYVGPVADFGWSHQHDLGRQAAQKLIDYTTRHYSTGDEGDKRQLRQRLLQAGFLDPRAVAFFFIARLAAAVVLGGLAFMLSPMLLSGPDGTAWMVAWVGGLLGYFGPNIYVNRRIAARQVEHRTGFPDFMDLLVVCADAGLSMEAALDRVGRELGDSYPSLSANVYMTTLEMRAGRTLSEALEHFGDRLGLEEARSFATLLQQSEELGSSLTEALRVYSDDMRHKRMSRAEEKAYSLPARLSVPLMVCIFPVIIIVIMLPVYVRFKMSAF